MATANIRFNPLFTTLCKKTVLVPPTRSGDSLEPLHVRNRKNKVAVRRFQREAPTPGCGCFY